MNGAEYLVKHLENLGYAMQGMSGYIPLSFQEIYAYMKATNTPFSADEALILKKMSNAYVSQSYDKDPTSKMPFGDTEDNKVNLDTSSILALFGVS